MQNLLRSGAHSKSQRPVSSCGLKLNGSLARTAAGYGCLSLPMAGSRDSRARIEPAACPGRSSGPANFAVVAGHRFVIEQGLWAADCSVWDAPQKRSQIKAIVCELSSDQRPALEC